MIVILRHCHKDIKTDVLHRYFTLKLLLVKMYHSLLIVKSWKLNINVHTACTRLCQLCHVNKECRKNG